MRGSKGERQNVYGGRVVVCWLIGWLVGWQAGQRFPQVRFAPRSGDFTAEELIVAGIPGRRSVVQDRSKKYVEFDLAAAAEWYSIFPRFVSAQSTLWICWSNIVNKSLAVDHK